MAGPTYSLATLGTSTQQLVHGALKTLQVPDTDQSGSAVRDAIPAAAGNGAVGGINYGAGYTMRTGTHVLCKNPDGSQSYYKIDSELSRPGALVLRPIGS